MFNKRVAFAAFIICVAVMASPITNEDNWMELETAARGVDVCKKQPKSEACKTACKANQCKKPSHQLGVHADNKKNPSTPDCKGIYTSTYDKDGCCTAQQRCDNFENCEWMGSCQDYDPTTGKKGTGGHLMELETAARGVDVCKKQPKSEACKTACKANQCKKPSHQLGVHADNKKNPSTPDCKGIYTSTYDDDGCCTAQQRCDHFENCEWMGSCQDYDPTTGKKGTQLIELETAARGVDECKKDPKSEACKTACKVTKNQCSLPSHKLGRRGDCKGIYTSTYGDDGCCTAQQRCDYFENCEWMGSCQDYDPTTGKKGTGGRL